MVLMKIGCFCLLLTSMAVGTAYAEVLPPKPYGALPNQRQLLWHELEFYGFLHFTVNTFTDKEWGYGDESPELFNPTDYDPEQIVRTAKEAGMKGLILTCKHHDGFCLWPSKYTEHSVKNSAWQNGQGDVVRDISATCKKHGLKFGVYLSPWDRNHKDYARPEYITYFRNQLTELLTQYGPIYEVWFDGANGGDGYYGGARETRHIDRSTYYDWDTTWAMVHQLRPDAVIFSDVGDVRWVGNESGFAGDPCWATYSPKARAGETKPQPGNTVYQQATNGHRDGKFWMPAEADVSIRPGWFYHASQDARVRTPENIVDLYYLSVGRGASFLLNLPPDRRGRIHENDVKALRGFRRIMDQTFGVDLAQGAKIDASNVRGESRRFAAAYVRDGDRQTYWSTDDGVTVAELILALKERTTFNVVSLREYLPLGQRVHNWALDRWEDGLWAEFGKGESIGGRRLWRGPHITADKVRLRLAGPVCPAISEFALHAEPIRLSLPRIGRDRQGMLTIACDPAGPEIRYTLDGGEPTKQSPLFEQPFALPHGGTVRARAFVKEEAGDVATVTFGVAKTKWKVTGASTEAGGGAAQNAIDGDPNTAWHTWFGNKNKQNGSPPQFMTVDMGEEIEVAALTYTPRANLLNGRVSAFELYLSRDGHNWGAAVAAGDFDNIVNNPLQQRIELKRPVRARFFEFVATKVVPSDDNDHVVVNELGIVPAAR